MKRFILSAICTIMVFSALQAQELNTKLTINTNKLQSANTQLFAGLERTLNQLLNEHKWTDAAFNKSERINCNVTIYVNEMAEGNVYKGEIQISAQRPVYNSTYVTSLFNYRDTQFEFSYVQGQTFDFNSFNVDNNLVAVISFYAYLIIGFDFDSFSLNGGSPYFTRAMDIANMAQSLGTKGWEPFSGKNNNRYDLAVALTEESSKGFHSLWYNYHRTGLDEMAANPSRGRIRIMETINNDAAKLKEARPSSFLFTILGETKVDEIVQICSQATAEEKQNMKKVLSNMFPVKTSTINNLK